MFYITIKMLLYNLETTKKKKEKKKNPKAPKPKISHWAAASDLHAVSWKQKYN